MRRRALRHRGERKNGRVKAGRGAGRVVGVAGVRGGQAADKARAGMKNARLGESFSHRQVMMIETRK